MIYLRADGRKASITKDQPITTGSVGMKVDVSLSEDYDGLSSVVVFTAGSVSADVMYVGDPIDVPSQVLLEPGLPLHVGVYGQSADGRIAIPTVWAAAGVIQIGTKPSGIDPAEPTPSWAAQVQQWAEEAHDTAERLAEEVDGWEADENERIAAESARAAAEASRARAEATRYSNESTRATNEASRVLAEQDRQSAEAERASAESSRVAAEASRANAETARADAETGRASAESQRASAEAERKTAESGRASAESSRRTAESGRASAEQARVSAEQQRVTAESTREDAEAARDADWASVRTAAVNATSAANAAATSASTAASGANEAVTDLRAAAARGDFDGCSPTVEIESTDTTHTVTITDGEGPHAYTVPTYAEEEQARAYAWNELSEEVQDATDAANEAAAAVEPETKQLFGNQLTGTLSGTIDTASDAYAAPPMALTVEGVSTQAGTPTPDAPEPIESVDELTVTFAGKNLYGSGDQTFTQVTPLVVLLPAGTYTVSALVTSSDTDTQTCSFLFRYVDGSYSALMQLGRDTRSHATTTLVKPVTSIRLYAAASSNSGIGDTATWKDIQIEAGSTATAYAPYVEPTTVPDLLPEGTDLRSLPDGTKDTLNLSYLRPSTREGWAWYRPELLQRVVETIIDGNHTIVQVQNENYLRVNLNVPTYEHSTAMADQLSWGPGIATNSMTVGANTTVYAWLSYSDFPTIADYKAHIAEHPMTLLYARATPVTTQLDPIELPQLPAPTATVWCDGGSATPSFVMEYVKDTNIVIANMQTMLDDLATS